MPAQKQIGFTLIELLIVIVIIAILTVVAVAVYSGAQKGARDAKRRADIDAVTKAMEVYFIKSSSGKYDNPPQNSWFSGGIIPTDPLSSRIGDRTPGCGNHSAIDGFVNACWYCIKANNTPSLCASGDHRLDDPGNEWSTDSHNHPVSWAICANLEIGDSKYYCKKNQQ